MQYGNLIGTVQIPTIVNDHSSLVNRDAPNQHPISSITDLQNKLDGKVESSNAMTNMDIENILGGFV